MCPEIISKGQIMSGTIDISQLNTPPEKHEFEAAKFFADRGKDIVFIKPSDIPGVHTPDIKMDGVEWELKCPQGDSKRTIEQNFRKAMKQSQYIIFDLRRIKVSEKLCLAQLKEFFDTKKRVKRLLIIRKNGDLLEHPEK